MYIWSLDCLAEVLYVLIKEHVLLCVVLLEGQEHLTDHVVVVKVLIGQEVLHCLVDV